MNVVLAKGTRATFVGNKVRILGKILVYGVNDIENLPSDLDPRQSSTVEDDHMLAFFSRYSPLSNFNNSSHSVVQQKPSVMKELLRKYVRQMIQLIRRHLPGPLKLNLEN